MIKAHLRSPSLVSNTFMCFFEVQCQEDPIRQSEVNRTIDQHGLQTRAGLDIDGGSCFYADIEESGKTVLESKHRGRGGKLRSTAGISLKQGESAGSRSQRKRPEVKKKIHRSPGGPETERKSE